MRATGRRNRNKMERIIKKATISTKDGQANERQLDEKCRSETEIRNNTVRMPALHSQLDEDKRVYKEQKSKVKKRNREKKRAKYGVERTENWC